MIKNGVMRKAVTYAFAFISFLVAVIFSEAIAVVAEKNGWDQIFLSGWNLVTDLDLEDGVMFGFFALGGATLALWLEFWVRDKREATIKKNQSATICRADFTFSTSEKGALETILGHQSENVSYYAWVVNNGGTMHNESVMLFVEFERPIELLEVFAHSNDPEGEWQQFASTERFMFVEIKGWPEGDVSLLAIASKSLGLNRRSELKIWRKFGPMDSKTLSAE